MIDRRPAPPLDIFVPDFCQPRAVAIIIIGAELLAFTLVLTTADSWSMGVNQLAITSLYVQWAALLSGGLLCISRRALVRMPTALSAAVAFAIPLLVNLVLTVTAHALATRGLMFGTWSAPRSLGEDLTRNLIVAAIIGGVVLRYLYIRHEAEKNLAAQHQANIDALQARIRPHFLFNSLNTIISLVREQPDVAENALQDLAELFRHNLRQSEQMTRLGDDILLCKQYLALEQLRLGERLQVHWRLQELESNQNLPIPPLVLQPLLENAVYHGIEPLSTPGTITVSGQLIDNCYRILITNPLPVTGRVGRTDLSTNQTGNPASGHQIAVDNVRQRLFAHFGEQAALQINVVADLYSVSIDLPR